MKTEVHLDYVHKAYFVTRRNDSPCPLHI